jgi:hypothetical protein
MSTIKLIWSWLSGNKTIICMTSVAIIQKLIELKLLEKSNIIEFIIWLLIALGTGALVQHIQKGYFSTEKGA